MRLYIREMLAAQGAHISFHTPGHKRAGEDITELSYSDCLLSPHGVIAAAERDCARILGADATFFLTDGSTSGIFSMLYALKKRGARSVAAGISSHRSVKNACAVLGLTLVPVPQRAAYGIFRQPTPGEAEEALSAADALLLTSPDYYGFFAPMSEMRSLCDRCGKPLLLDGAHGSHLHGAPLYGGKFADMWVDGLHKSLPALTQGAAVSARGAWTEFLWEGVRTFRTTSPSYPILASCEEAVKYPRNEGIERAAAALKRRTGALGNDDWTKVVIPFGREAAAAQAALERAGVYPEFNDGNYLMFYLSPCTTEEELGTLEGLLSVLPRGSVGEDAPCGAIPIYSEE